MLPGATALFTDPGVVLLTVSLFDGLPATATDLGVELTSVLGLQGFPTLLADLGVELASAVLGDGFAALLADLRVELWTVSLFNGLPALSAGLAHRHLFLLLCHLPPPPSQFGMGTELMLDRCLLGAYLPFSFSKPIHLAAAPTCRAVLSTGSLETERSSLSLV